MRVFRGPGDDPSFTAPAGGVLNNQPILIGDFFGVSTRDAAEGERFVPRPRGEFLLAKTDGVALVEFQLCRFKVATGELGDDPLDPAVGICRVDAAGGDARVLVLIG